MSGRSHRRDELRRSRQAARREAATPEMVKEFGQSAVDMWVLFGGRPYELRPDGSGTYVLGGALRRLGFRPAPEEKPKRTVRVRGQSVSVQAYDGMRSRLKSWAKNRLANRAARKARARG